MPNNLVIIQSALTLSLAVGRRTYFSVAETATTRLKASNLAAVSKVMCSVSRFARLRDGKFNGLKCNPKNSKLLSARIIESRLGKIDGFYLCIS